MQIFDQMTSGIVSIDKYCLYYCDPQEPQSTARKAEIQMMTAATACADRWKKAQLSHFPVDESLAGALLSSRAEQGKVTVQLLPLHRNYFAWRNRSLWGKATSVWTTLTHLLTLFS